jgi:16S rRNA (adenine1518-N6/adenine1519-N6)-dimethyltransferase
MPASPLASPTATADVLRAHGLYTKKRLGQHFLVDDNVIARILELAALSPSDVALEVGPGIGTLTVALCSAAGAVVAIEHDADLLPVLAQTTAACPRIAVIEADAVAVSAQRIAEPFGPPTALVANLPYQVAATVVLRYFEMLPTLRHATVMVQAEVADRMAASPGGKEYGAYTVKLRLRAQAAGRFAVARTCFMPPPRVDSAVIRLERREPGTAPADVAHAAAAEGIIAAASRVADAAFAQRRKTIRNSLRAKLDVPVDRLDAALEAAGIDPGCRAETLDPEAFVALAQALG